MFRSSIKLDKTLLARVKRYSDLAGYSSVEEFITHALEKQIAQLETADYFPAFFSSSSMIDLNDSNGCAPTT